LWEQSRGGSSPLFRTNFRKGPEYRGLSHFSRAIAHELLASAEDSMRELDPIESGVMRALAPTPTDAGGYNEVVIAGVVRSAVSDAVERLAEAGYVNAKFVRAGLGDDAPIWEASSVTAQGRSWLERH
jgi:hypothetical protein